MGSAPFSGPSVLESESPRVLMGICTSECPQGDALRSLTLSESARGIATIPQGVKRAVLFSLAEQRDLQRISNRRLGQGAVRMCGPVYFVACAAQWALFSEARAKRGQ